jgi:hypothetical protein
MPARPNTATLGRASLGLTYPSDTRSPHIAPKRYTPPSRRDASKPFLGWRRAQRGPTSGAQRARAPKHCDVGPRFAWPNLCMDSPPQSTTAFPTDLGCIYVSGLCSAAMRRGQHRVSSRNANYEKASGTSRLVGITPRRSDLGFVRLAAGWAPSPGKMGGVCVGGNPLRSRQRARRSDLLASSAHR